MAMPNGVQMTNSESRTPSRNSSSSDRDDIDLDSTGLPPERSRNGKWWYSTFHNVTAIVGAGVLGLPTVMAYLGWGGGVVVLVLSWVVTLFTLWQMVQMHELEQGVRNDTYNQLGQRAFGPKLGLWIVLPQQLIVQVGSDIVYLVTGGQALWLVYQLFHCEKDDFDALEIGSGNCCGKMGPAAWIIIFATPQLFLSQLGDFNAIASLSLVAAMMSFCYCTIAWIESLKRGIHNHSSASPQGDCSSDYHLPRNLTGHENNTANQIFGAFSALGVIAFAYAGHNVVLEIQATLPSTPKKPSKIRMWRGVVVAYIIVAICYFPVAFVGYWAYGSQLPFMGTSSENPIGGNIFWQLDSIPRGVIAVASLMVATHVTGSYQVYAMPVFELIEGVLVHKFGFRPTPPRSTSMMRIVSRSTYVVFTAFVACTFPFFNDLLAFFGGFAFTPTTYFLPCIIWLKLKRPSAFSMSWIINWLLIFFGVFMMIFGTIGGMRNIIRDSSKYRFYPFHCDNKNRNTTCRHVHFY